MALCNCGQRAQKGLVADPAAKRLDHNAIFGMEVQSWGWNHSGIGLVQPSVRQETSRETAIAENVDAPPLRIIREISKRASIQQGELHLIGQWPDADGPKPLNRACIHVHQAEMPGLAVLNDIHQ